MSDIEAGPVQHISTEYDGPDTLQEVRPDGKSRRTVAGIPVYGLLLAIIAGILVGSGITVAFVTPKLLDAQTQIHHLNTGIRDLQSEKANLQNQLADAKQQVAIDQTKINSCEAKVDYLNKMRAALGEQLTAWGQNPLGYTIDPTQIAQYRDLADAITNC